MGSDTPCALTGGCYYTSTDIISRDLERGPYHLKETRLELPSVDILKRLQYTQEDVDASQDLVLLVPKNAKGELEVDDFEGPMPTTYTADTVEAVFNFTIGDNPDLSGFVIRDPAARDEEDPDSNSDDESEPDIHVSMYGGYNKFYIYLYAYRILVGRYPELTPPIIYATLARRYVTHYDDPAMCNIIDQYASYTSVAEVEDKPYPLDDMWDDVSDSEYFWIKFLTDETMSEEQKVHEAWMGKGRMYRLVRADRFPQALPLATFPTGTSPDTTFTKLPFDVLDYLCVTYLSVRDASRLLTLSRTLRHTLTPFINTFAHRAIAREYPWYLPIQDAECLRGDEEMESWLDMWDRQLDSIPWCAYVREASASPSMRNRERIWHIAGRFRDEAKAGGFLEA